MLRPRRRGLRGRDDRRVVGIRGAVHPVRAARPRPSRRMAAARGMQTPTGACSRSRFARSNDWRPP